MPEQRRVVVTGLGTVSPVGNTAPEAWTNLLAGCSGIDRLTLFKRFFPYHNIVYILQIAR